MLLKRTRAKLLMRAAAVAALGVSVTACSSVPDWVDPTTWIGGDSTPSAADQADQQATANAQTPDLASVPDKPAAPSTSDQQKQLTDSLETDRTHAQYSADALHGGTESAAAPPPNTPPPSQVAEIPSPGQSAPPPSANASAADQTPPPPPQDTGTIDAAAAANTSTAADQTGPAEGTTAAAAPAAPPPAAAPAPATQMAMNTPPPAATPPSAPMPAPQATVSPSDAALGFKPSTAPPLDASVAQFVPQPVIARYQQTASIAGSTGVSAGGYYTGGYGGSALETVFFRGDTTVLNAKSKEQVRAAAEAYRQRGGQGFIRVVGHASGANRKLSRDRQLVWNFEHSHARAESIARELIKDGVPADKVLVEAVGDSHPVYFDSMPSGEDGNRSAEIFLQG